MRPLYDDGAHDPSAITRDYVLKVDAQPRATRRRTGRRAPLLSVFGGKITTYRKLAEAALVELRPFFPAMKGAWTDTAQLPGGDLPRGDRAAWLGELCRRYPALDPEPAARAREAPRHARAGDPGRREEARRSRRGFRRATQPSARSRTW